MKIREVQLLSTQLPALENFYTQKLLLKIIKKSTESISFQIGESILTFIHSPSRTSPYHFAFNIPEKSILTCYDYYKGKLNFIKNIENPDRQPPIYDFVNWNAKALYFLDPDNNILEFIARKNVGAYWERGFTENNIISISEIGIVVDDAMETAQEYHDKYGLSTFDKSSGSSSFHPLGDDNGLLILSKEKRIWYTTHFKAEKQYSKVRIEMNGKEFEFSSK